jgi:hypothetical protein
MGSVASATCNSNYYGDFRHCKECNCHDDSKKITYVKLQSCRMASLPFHVLANVVSKAFLTNYVHTFLEVTYKCNCGSTRYYTVDYGPDGVKIRSGYYNNKSVLVFDYSKSIKDDTMGSLRKFVYGLKRNEFMSHNFHWTANNAKHFANRVYNWMS